MKIMKKQSLLNTYVNNVDMSEALSAIDAMISSGKKSYIVAINVDVVMKIENGYEYLGYCDCKIKEINNGRIAKSGLSDIINKYTFENFKTKRMAKKV